MEGGGQPPNGAPTHTTLWLILGAEAPAEQIQGRLLSIHIAPVQQLQRVWRRPMAGPLPGRAIAWSTTTRACPSGERDGPPIAPPPPSAPMRKDGYQARAEGAPYALAEAERLEQRGGGGLEDSSQAAPHQSFVWNGGGTHPSIEEGA